MFHSTKKSLFSIGGIAILFLGIYFLFSSGLLFNKNHPAQPKNTLNELLDNVNTEQINWNESERSLPDGIYYEYAGSSGGGESESRRITHPDLILGYLAGKGADLQEAWYKRYSSSCSPPDSDMAMDVIVPAKLLIRVGNTLPEEELSSLGLSRVKEPSIGTCPYNIRHYRFTGSK